MSAALARAQLLAIRARRKLGRRRVLPPYREIFLPHVRGRSFADIGAMWSVDGRYALEAQAGGAATATAVDVMPESPSFRAAREQRGPSVRFVRTDVNDPESAERVGVHDVVWSSGLLYHQPSPLHTVGRLAALAGETLLVHSATVPEVPGLPQACVLYPGLDDGARRAYGRIYPGSVGLETPFEPAGGYANWWWGISPSALRAMVGIQPGFEVVEVVRAETDTVVIARRSPPPG